MNSVSSTILYIFAFFSVYVQVFFLFTFIENRKKIVIRKGVTKLAKYPGVTVIVPCWNEEGTIYKTVRSLLHLHYPQDKLKIILIDDGSTDGTWHALKKFSGYSNIKVFKKENGGKYTALNLGLDHTTTEFVGCLDADSTAHPEALVRIMSYFERDATIMAVAPSVVASSSKSFVQKAQRSEYYMSVYTKKMLAFMGAIHVTPGPLTIFKKKVFDDLGKYRHAHNTEDMEIAYRMQKNYYKIEQCNDAYIYTNTPPTAFTLYKQRLRWIYGFINNTIDYRDLLFKKKYGNFSTFTVPAGVISVITASFFIGRILYNIADFLYSKFVAYQTVGFDFSVNIFQFDFFFLNTKALIFLTLMIYTSVFFSIVLGRRMTEGDWRVSFDLVLFFIVFSFVAPFWLGRAIFNTLFSRKPAWR